MRLEISKIRNIGKYRNYTLFSNQWHKEELKRGIRKYLQTTKHNKPRLMRCSINNNRRKVYGNKKEERS